MTQIAIWGEKGKMGREVKNLLPDFPDLSIAPSLKEAIGVIDFSSPEGLMSLLDQLEKEKSAAWVISGSTGLNGEQRQALERKSHGRTILWAANFSLGILAIERVLSAIRTFPELSGFVPRIQETHHVHKKDSPSGTALSLKKLLPPTTQIESIREGEVVGSHEIWFESASERVGLIHEAQDRSIFARGTLQCAITLTRLLRENPRKIPQRLLELRDLFSG